MKKLFVLCLFISSLFATQSKQINSIEDIDTNKEVILVFSIPSCPWCIRQISVLEKIKEKRDSLQIVKVLKDSSIYTELKEKYPFPVEFYPTSFLVEKEDNELNIKYEFQGFQKQKNIIKVLNSIDEF